MDAARTSRRWRHPLPSSLLPSHTRAFAAPLLCPHTHAPSRIPALHRSAAPQGARLVADMQVPQAVANRAVRPQSAAQQQYRHQQRAVVALHERLVSATAAAAAALVLAVAPAADNGARPSSSLTFTYPSKLVKEKLEARDEYAEFQCKGGMFDCDSDRCALPSGGGRARAAGFCRHPPCTCTPPPPHTHTTPTTSRREYAKAQWAALLERGGPQRLAAGGGDKAAARPADQQQQQQGP